jgi:hypothetical protein
MSGHYWVLWASSLPPKRGALSMYYAILDKFETVNESITI